MAFFIGEEVVEPVVDFGTCSEEAEADFVAVGSHDGRDAFNVPFCGIENEFFGMVAIFLFSSEEIHEGHAAHALVVDCACKMETVAICEASFGGVFNFVVVGFGNGINGEANVCGTFESTEGFGTCGGEGVANIV